jgi:hypothetical protein
MLRYTRFGCLLAVLWLVLALIGASPQLHRALHQDANSPEHSCVIEHISQGLFLFSPDSVVTIVRSEPILSPPATPALFVSSRDFGMAPNRGPPSLRTFRTVAG